MHGDGGDGNLRSTAFQSENDFRDSKIDFRDSKKDFRGSENEFRDSKKDFRGSENDFRGSEIEFRGFFADLGKISSDIETGVSGYSYHSCNASLPNQILRPLRKVIKKKSGHFSF